MKKNKAYIVYGGSGDMLSATLVMENGWAPFGHLCSHPAYMPGDLLLNRPERQAILQNMGLEVELVLPAIAGSDNPALPEGLIAKHQAKEGWQAMADEYDAIEKAQIEAPKP